MKKSAFTLLEIMITVGVVAVVGSMGAFSVLKGVRKARINQARIDLEIMSAAMLQMASDTGRWPNGALRTNPGSTEIWNLTGTKVGLLANSAIYSEWKGPYVDEIKVDPWGNPYFFDPDYLIKGVNHVVVGSFGPNGVGQNLYDSDDIYVLLDD
jgi:prepilin-type N-terminal cleavage/methylation domain-containing protein